MTPITKDGPLRGFRHWAVRQERDGKIVMGAAGYGDIPWQGGVEQAKCRKDKVHDRTPDLNCTCGIWGYWKYEDARKGGNNYNGWPGIIEIWGRVIPGELGFRAEFAQPVAFLVPQCGHVEVSYDEKYNVTRTACTDPATTKVVFPEWAEPFPAANVKAFQYARSTIAWQPQAGILTAKGARCDQHRQDFAREPRHGKWCLGNGRVRYVNGTKTDKCYRRAGMWGFCDEHRPFALSVERIVKQLADRYEADVLPNLELQLDEEEVS
jgi:hypothetical protein